MFVKLVYFKRNTEQKMGKMLLQINCINNGVTNGLSKNKNKKHSTKNKIAQDKKKALIEEGKGAY